MPSHPGRNLVETLASPDSKGLTRRSRGLQVIPSKCGTCCCSNWVWGTHTGLFKCLRWMEKLSRSPTMGLGRHLPSPILDAQHSFPSMRKWSKILNWTKIPNWRLLLRRQGMLWWNILSSMKIFKCGWTISIFFSTNLMVKDFGSIIHIKGVKLVPSFC